MKISIKILLLFTLMAAYSSLTCAQGTHDEIEEQLTKFKEQHQTEKLFGHTDKNFYLAGEILWFKLYYVDGTLHTPLDLSKVAYVEILDKDLKPVLQAKVPLSEGSGKGSLYLPFSMSSGMYRFRAYTQWMKNFSADYFFERPLTVINSTRNLEAQQQRDSGYEVTFFPESGVLVQNIPTRVAFRISNRFGKGENCKGVVLNQDNDTVQVFQTQKFGIGNFLLTPKDGDTYKSKITIGDTTISTDLPIAREQGYVMNVFREGGTKLRIQVSTNNHSLHAIHLVGHTRQVINLSERKSINNGIAEFIIDKSALGEGISHFTLFNEAKQPLCERLYFVRPRKKLMIESVPDAVVQSPRKKISIGILSKDETGKPVPADLSVSVYYAGTDSISRDTDISSYFWLESDLRGKIESPGFYFSETGMEGEIAADNLMMTHGWRRFLWQDVFTNKDVRDEFIPEFRDHIIHAKITNPKTGLPAPDILTYLSVPGKRIQLYSSKSDSAGRLKFYTADFYGPNEILLQTERQTDTFYKIEIVSPFSEKFSPALSSIVDLPVKTQSPLVDQSVSVQVQNLFAGDRMNQLYSPLIDSNGFYGPPDNSYMLDDYVRFSTMEEVLREYVVEVLVRRQKENFRLMMSGGVENKIFMDDPLTLFNGVPVFETNKIMQYDPLKVHKIEVVKRRYFYGPSTMNGIVNFTTYQPDPAMLSGLNAVVFDYEGLQFDREFYSPVYETQVQVNGRMPDFRNVLFWSPSIRTGPQGKTQFDFYTSDMKGKYVVVIQGMAKDGKAGQEVVNVEVK